MPESAGLWGLFVSAFVSSTLLPGGSEVVLAVVAQDPTHSRLLLLAVAASGNTLGGMSSWLIGRLLPAAAAAPDRARAVIRVRRWGCPVLLMSWLPLVGDPLCVAAGWLRCSWLRSLLFIAAGKAARYAFVLWLV